MLQAARLIDQIATLPYGQAVEPGTRLALIASGDILDCHAFAQRDNELQYRDLVTAANALKVAMQLSSIWAFETPKIAIPVPPVATIESNALDLDDAHAAQGAHVVHVKNASVPYDAVGVDKQLYYRDVVVLEALARLSAVVDAGVEAISAGITIPDTWSLAMGSANTAEVGESLRLSRDLFKLPDQNLAFRDTQLAAITAKLEAILTSPLDYANRLYAAVDGAEAEIYTLATDECTDTLRVWQREPAIAGYNKLVYNLVDRTLLVIGADAGIRAANPVPSPVDANGVSVPLETDDVTISTSLPLVKIENYLGAAEAFSDGGAVALDGRSVVNGEIYGALAAPAGMKVGRSSLVTSIGTYRYLLPCGLKTGSYLVSLLATPKTSFDVNGCDFQAVSSGVNLTVAASGDAVQFHNGTAGPAELWAEYPCVLPGSGWDVNFVYAATANFTYSIHGPLTVVNVSALAVDTVSTVHAYSSSGFPLRLSVTLPAGATVTVSALQFANDAVSSDYTVAGSLTQADGTAPAGAVAMTSSVNELSAVASQPLVLTFTFDVAPTGSEPFQIDYPYLSLSFSAITALPLAIQQLQVQVAVTVEPTTADYGFDNWKDELTNRALAAAAASYCKQLNRPSEQPYQYPPLDTFGYRYRVVFDTSILLMGSNCGATTETGEPSHGPRGEVGGRSVWWGWRATHDCTVTAVLSVDFGTAAIGYLAVYHCTDAGDLDNFAKLSLVSRHAVDSVVGTALGGGPNADGDTVTTITFSAVSGEEYAFAVDGAASAFGGISFRLSVNHPANDIVALAMTLTGFGQFGVDPGSVSANGCLWFKYATPGDAGTQTLRLLTDVARVTAEDAPGFNVYSDAGVTEVPLADLSETGCVFTAVPGVTYYFKVTGSLEPYTLSLLPEFRKIASTLYWDATSFDAWMRVMAIDQSQLFSVFRRSLPGDLGKPALVPRGLAFDGGLATSTSTSNDPLLTPAQPWLIAAGVYVIDSSFWPSDSFAAPSSLTDAALPPAAPASVKAVFSASPRRLTVTWSPVKYATSYTVLLTRPGLSSSTAVGDMTTWYESGDVTSGVTYHFRVFATSPLGGDGQPSYSTAVTVP